MATFKLEKEEYVFACLKLSMKSRFRIALIILAALLLLTGVMEIMRGGKLSVSTVASAVFLIFVLPLSRFFTKSRLEKAYEDQALLREPIEAEITAEDIRYTHETGTNLLLWSRVKKWSEDRRFFYLYESDQFARILPKRALSPEEEGIIRARTAGLKRV